MDFKNLLPAKNRDELRQWLMKNHRKESECWVVVKRGRPGHSGILMLSKKPCDLAGLTAPQRKWTMGLRHKD